MSVAASPPSEKQIALEVLRLRPEPAALSTQPVRSHVDERLGVGVEDRAADHPREEDAVVPAGELAVDLKVEEAIAAARTGPPRAASRRVRPSNAGVGLETPAEVADQVLAADASWLSANRPDDSIQSATNRSRWTAAVTIGGSKPPAGPSSRAYPWSGAAAGRQDVQTARHPAEGLAEA